MFAVAPTGAHEIGGFASQARIAGERGCDRVSHFAEGAKAGGALKHPPHPRAHACAPAMAGSAHHIFAQRSALNACVVSDAGSQPDLAAAALSLGAGLGSSGCAREHDIAGSAHGPEVGAACNRVIAIGEADCDKAETARLHGLPIDGLFLAPIELRRHDWMFRMARLNGLREIRVARSVFEKSSSACAAASASRET